MDVGGAWPSLVKLLVSCSYYIFPVPAGVLLSEKLKITLARYGVAGQQKRERGYSVSLPAMPSLAKARLV